MRSHDSFVLDKHKSDLHAPPRERDHNDEADFWQALPKNVHQINLSWKAYDNYSLGSFYHEELLRTLSNILVIGTRHMGV
jgi:hypothetical protein